MTEAKVKYNNGYFEFEVGKDQWIRSDQVSMDIFSTYFVFTKYGEKIPLNELLYWNVGKQIPYKNVSEIKEDFRVNVIKEYK